MKCFASLLCAVVSFLAAFGEPVELNPVIPFLAITGRPTDAELAAKVAARAQAVRAGDGEELRFEELR